MDLIVGTLQFDFTIHAPREGSDFFVIFAVCCALFSIHAPREGSDPVALAAH